MANEIEPVVSEKAAFMDTMKSLRPDLFYPVEWTDDQRNQVSEMIKPAKVRTALFASIPLRCKGQGGRDCKFKTVCPLFQEGIAPGNNSICPIELATAQQFMTEYIDELGVDPNNLVEVSIVRDMVDQEIQSLRKAWLLSMEDFIQENPIGTDDKGNVVYRKELHLAVELEDKLHRRKRDLRNQLLATREARAKVGQGTLDTAQTLSKILDQVREIDIAKQKKLNARLGFDEEFADFIDAEVVPEEPDGGSS